MFAAKDTLLTRPSGAAYEISRSLRFNNPTDTAYLNRTPATTTNRRTWTWSAWIKRGLIDLNYRTLFSNGTAVDSIMFWNTDSFAVRNFNGSSYDLILTQVFRDPSAWYHFVVAMDTTQATSSDRIKIYVNGVQVTAFSSATYPSQNYDTGFNTTTVQYIGWNEYNYFNGYLTELNWIDGQQLTPSSFGETNAQTGVWGPKAYGGSYGTNGFYLNFSDNSNTTAATLGKDYSGNGNNWTPNNFSVTAGAGNDSMVDVPTPYGVDTGAGGTVRGNYCTLNPLIVNYATLTYSNGNLEGAATGGGWSGMQGTLSVSTGKWYWEVTHTSTDNIFIGIARTTMDFASINPQNTSGSIVYFATDGNKRVDGTNSAYGASFTIGNVIGVALDLDANTVTFYKNNASQGAISLASTTLNGTNIIPLNAVATSSTTAICNFGQRPFAYTAPSGFKALCTQNLPTPTIGATSATLATQFFAPVTYAGTGATQTVTVGFQPDFVWIKNRTNSANWHVLTDSVRGIQKELYSNSTTAEGTLTTSGVNQFNASSFQILGNNNDYNGNTSNYVAWNWRAGNNAGASNSAGSITSTVSASTTSGFSVVTYTGTGSAGATVGHGLGVVPSMIIFKKRDGSSDWQTYHTSLGNANSVYLNLTNASAASPGMLNSTTPTSTLITLGTSTDTNPSAGTMVAYCFAAVAGYSAFGTYTGNGSADGPFVFTGFRPAFVMFKVTSVADEWRIYDEDRLGYNTVANILVPNASDAEGVTGAPVDLVSNGFKIRGTAGSNVINGSGQTYIFAAFASSPFKFSLAR
jgi:hypothetical protein